MIDYRLSLVTWIAACPFAYGCAHETQERPLHTTPVEAPRASTATPPPVPFPSSAFTSEAAPTSHFETRRIGVEAPRAHRFDGAPVDLDLKGADLANVFRLLADVGHVNIVVAGEVTGTITLVLKHVPWDEALELVVRAKNLDMEREGNVIVIRR